MLKLYHRDESSSEYRLTGESFAIVREKLGIPLPKEIYQQHLEHGGKFRALEAEVVKLTKVEIAYETLKEVDAENVSLRQIEAEAARLHLLHPEDEKFRMLQHFASWSHRVQGSRSAVRKTKSAESRATQPSPQMPPSKPVTEPVESELCQNPTHNHLQRLRQWIYDWSL